MKQPPRLRWLMAVQAVLILVALFVPFGFDHRSSWGLDFGHLLIVLAVFALVLLGGLVLACKQRLWTALALQILGAAVAVYAAAGS